MGWPLPEQASLPFHSQNACAQRLAAASSPHDSSPPPSGQLLPPVPFPPFPPAPVLATSSGEPEHEARSAPQIEATPNNAKPLTQPLRERNHSAKCAGPRRRIVGGGRQPVRPWAMHACIRTPIMRSTALRNTSWNGSSIPSSRSEDPEPRKSVEGVVATRRHVAGLRSRVFARA